MDRGGRIHEAGIAAELIARVRERLEGVPHGAVRAVRLAVGDLAGVNVDALEFAFDCLARETPLAGARLVVEQVPVTLLCRMCGTRGGIADWRFRCGHCGSDAVSVVAGRELDLRSLDVEDVEQEAPCTTSP